MDIEKEKCSHWAFQHLITIEKKICKLKIYVFATKES